MYQSKYPKEAKRIVQYLLTILFVSILPSKIHAITISPSYIETYSGYEKQTNQTFTITNDKDVDLQFKPTVYKYYPPADYLSDAKEHEIFSIIDNETITVPANSSKDIKFQVYAKPSLEYGTYYNLIALQLQSGQSEDSVGALPSISVLSVLHLIEKDVKGVTDDYSFDIEVVKKGIPFLKPAEVKITIFNNSKYTLIPIGEIQAVTYKQKQEPEYKKVNIQQNKIYPEDSYEENIQLKKWSIQDIFFSKTIYAKIYNGLDDNFITKEINLPTYKNELLYTLVILLVIYGLLKSVKRDLKQN